MVLGTDSSAAKSFVARRGLGRMRHIEVRGLWLQQEVLKGVVKVVKIPGEENPADLMTKFLSTQEVAKRLEGMGIAVLEGNLVKPVGADGVRGQAVAKREGCLVRGRWADEEEENEEEDFKAVAALWSKAAEMSEPKCRLLFLSHL